MKFSLFTVFDNYKHVYDRTPEQFIEEVLQQTEAGDRLGYDSVWYAEHHFSEYGVLTSPNMLIAAAAQRTKKIRLGVSVAVLPLHNPLRIAEDYALADVLSGGRLNFGIGSGYLPHEFAGFNMTTENKAHIFNEALEIIKLAWSGERFSFKGNYFECTDVELNLLPVQRPMPPTWIAALRPAGAYYVAKMGYPIMGIPYVNANSIHELEEILSGYKETYKESGYDLDQLEIPLALHTYVAETSEQARKDSEEHINLYLKTRQYGKNARYDDLLAKEQLAIGSPEDVIQLIRKYEAIGMNHVMMLMNFGGMPHEKVMKSIELVAREVMPAFKGVNVF
ncbi:luciferase [Collibacillus ludicampi]|uniref:Luciferase n=1 Tax=Collibacillus ludicampi TaxID=2771369 RepID=A0AAV4LFS3_9BACL|nr:LLM class flavin-dependent oxidoreductase [Collibacillus ludicampi]GIM46548.1 luciferase [Collibacillus ludicampi]